MLHVDVGTNNSKGLLVTGTKNASATVPNLGEGVRLMFYPGKAAFRAGEVDALRWQDDKIGSRSVALGYNTLASGDASVALGHTTTASGSMASSFGHQTVASGVNAFSTGYFASAKGKVATTTGMFTRANGMASLAAGYQTFANGDASVSLGHNTKAKGYASTVVGIFNDSLLHVDETDVTPATPLFIVGNGNDFARSNAFVVRADGKVGVGNIVPQFRLDVEGRMRLRSGGTQSTSAGVWLNKVDNSGTTGFVGVYDDNTLGFYGPGADWGLTMNTDNGNVGIGTKTPGQRLSVVGNIVATGSITSTSDMRWKTEVAPLKPSLASVLQLHPITYNWKKEFPGYSAKRQVGFSAQELEEQFPELVQTDVHGYKSVDYSRLTPVLVQALKEQQLLIDQQAKETEALKTRLDKLEKRLAEMR